MNWHYLQELVAEFSEASCSDGAQSVPSSLSHSAKKCCSKDSATDCSPSSPSGATSRPSTGDPGVDAWISSLAVSRARTSPAPEQEQASKENGQGSGEKWLGSWVRYDHASSSWKTRQCLLLGGLAEYSATWPRWGTMRAGECWERTMPELLTDATGSGSSVPTPRASDADRGGRGELLHWTKTGTPRGRLWPTPSAGLHSLTENPGSFLDRQQKWKGTYSNSAPLTVAVKLVSPGARPAGSFGASGAYATGRSVDAQESMTEMSLTAREMWPTPLASDGAKDPTDSLSRLIQTGHRRGRRDGFTREGEEIARWPTPTRRDWKSGCASEATHDRNARPLSEVVHKQTPGSLNPDWVEWLMGWPVGWTSLEPLPGLGDWFSSDWWDDEPCPRVTTDKTNRVSRLKAIGNGQVPACVVMAWELL